MTDAVNRLSKILPLFLASMLIISGCGGGDASSGDASSRGTSPGDGATSDESTGSIPWRVDGQLTFSRDGAPLGTIEIEIADTDSSRTRGMMQRESIPEDWGMLFIFPNEEERGFWMANTPMALDLMFIDADSTIINIARYVQPMSAETISSEGPAQFVLEVEAGYSDSIGIVEGDDVSWTDAE